MIKRAEREQIVNWVDKASTAGARRDRACAVLGITVRTVQRWRQGGEVESDARTTRRYVPANKLSEAEREHLLAVANARPCKQFCVTAGVKRNRPSGLRIQS